MFARRASRPNARSADRGELFQLVVIQDVSTDPEACAVGHPGTDLMFAHYETNVTVLKDLQLISGEVVAQGVLAEGNDFASADAVNWSSGLQGNQCLAQREDGTVSLGCGGWIAVQFLTCYMQCVPAPLLIPGGLRSSLADDGLDYIGVVTIGEYGATCGDTAPDRYEVRLCENERTWWLWAIPRPAGSSSAAVAASGSFRLSFALPPFHAWCSSQAATPTLAPTSQTIEPHRRSS